MARARWKHIASRMVKLLRTDPCRAWEPVEEALRSGHLGERDRNHILLRAGQLAAQYGAAHLARDGIARWKASVEDAADPGRAATLQEVLFLAVDLASKDYARAEEVEALIDWEKVADDPCCVNVRLLAALRANKFHQMIDAIDGRRDCGAPYDRGSRLRIFGRWFLQQGKCHRAVGFFRAALREYARDDAVDARLKEIEIRGMLAHVAFQTGLFEEAEAMLLDAVREATAAGHAYYADVFSLEIARLHLYQGKAQRAQHVLAACLRRLKQRKFSAPLERVLYIDAVLWAGEAEIDLGNPARARTLARQAGALLRAGDHSRVRAHLEILRGRIKSSASRPQNWDEAFARFAEAERLLRSLGDGDPLAILSVVFYQGELHLKRRDLRAALASAVQCMEMAKAAEFVPMKARSLLLQSHLLLQEELPAADRLYEDVLRNLGSVKDPVILFKVIANLYFYTWELEGNLDLTDHHLKQIHKLAEVLDRKTFEDLYERHVCRRVARRFLAHTLGTGRPAGDDWAAEEP